MDEVVLELQSMKLDAYSSLTAKSVVYIRTNTPRKLVSWRKVSIFAANLETNGTMATAIKAIPTLYGEEARQFGEAALQAELSYEPKAQKPLSLRRRRARRLLSQAGLI